MQDLGLGQLAVSGMHRTVGPLGGWVENISAHGLRAGMEDRASQAHAILVGDRLGCLAIRSPRTELHTGTGSVRSVSMNGDTLVLGLELDGPGLDLNALYCQSTRASIQDRWQEACLSAQVSEVSPAFKVWTATLRTYLQAVEDFLSKEEQALNWADQATRELEIQQLLEIVAPDVIARISTARDELSSIVGTLSADEHAAHRAFCQRQLSPLFDQAPFVRRAKGKPLGYAGDYELMNMLYRSHDEGETLLGRIINQYATSETAARANIARILYLREKILAERWRARGRPFRVASVGCGPAHEIFSLLSDHPQSGQGLQLALIDQEERAIKFCEKSLAPLMRSTGARIHFIRESIRRLLVAGELGARLGERDLIYSGGLFDYLGDRSFCALLGVLYNALLPGGLLVVGNVGRGNPSRWIQEYMCEWFLNYRDEQELMGFQQELTPPPSDACVEAEQLGVNLFLLVRR